MFQPGDKVRLLHESGEGTIQKIFQNSTAIVLIDGFEQTISLSNLVLITSSKVIPQDKVQFQDSKIPPVGFCLSLELENQYILSYLLNETPDLILVSIVAEIPSGYRPLIHTTLNPFTKITLPTLTLQEISSVPIWTIRWIAHPANPIHDISDGYYQFKFKEAFLRKEPKMTLTSSKPMIIIPILNERSTISHQTTQTEEWNKQKWQKNLQQAQENSIPIPSDVIDLHIEKLPDELKKELKRSNAAPIHYQLHYFQKSIEAAFAHGIPSSMLIIHGKGEGILKKEIETLLKQYREKKMIKDFFTDWFNTGQTRISFQNKGFLD
ncbi:MAG: Smr/MutS family protein [Bacteroidia bacterium]|nr:Smr/MutS family protein [Bacteroidia bacterium]